MTDDSKYTRRLAEAIASETGGESKKETAIDQISFSEFLESSPPSKMVAVSHITTTKRVSGRHTIRVISTPAIKLYCENEHCNGIRVFRTDPNRGRPENDPRIEHVVYTCSNCMTTEKIFFLSLKFTAGKSNDGCAYKFGELPPFGPRIPSKLISLIRDDREDFVKGRNCESQGFGIGAYAYYRRIVERQKNVIFDKIISVAKRVSTDDKAIKALESAKKEKQFSKAVKLVKDGIPPTLFINGHNPLTLLHAALSEGLHSGKDGECLAAARDIRIVLTELADRLKQALRDEAELNAAVARLTKRKSKH